MNNTEALGRIAELEKQIAEIKAGLEKKEDGLWVPDNSERERYYFIDTDGAVLDSIQDLSDWDYLFQNYFKTREQAERHAKRLKLYNKLWKLAEHLNGDWVPDWTDSRIVKHAIKSEFDEFKVDSFSYSNLGAPIFRSQELAGKALSMLTDEEKEIFKNICRP